MARPVSLYKVSILDYSKELSHFTIGLVAITPTNQAATVTNLATLQTAIEAVEIGQTAKKATILSHVTVSSTPPSNKAAQRESKWLARYHDNTSGLVYRFEIPCADTSLLALNSDFMDTTLAAFTNLKSAFDAVALSPEGNAGVLDSLEFVGREL